MVSNDCLWVLADRRLSYSSARPPVDDAIKIMNLETNDGRGLLAYAGLGATTSGTQPSEWMAAVLRGRAGLGFEQALGVLAEVATRELPQHLALLPGGAHFILVPAFVKDRGPRFYSIDNIVEPSTQQHRYRFTSHQRTTDERSPSARLGLAGSGLAYLAPRRDSWRRQLFSLVKANDRGKVSDLAVADYLADLNYQTHRGMVDGTVGPRCVVVWRRRDHARNGRGGAQQFYSGTTRESSSAPIPSIGNGMDVTALLEVIMQTVLGSPSGGIEMDRLQDTHALNARLAQLPSDPDETLR